MRRFKDHITEAEQLDELSPRTKASYLKKASAQNKKVQKAYDKSVKSSPDAFFGDDSPKDQERMKTMTKRQKGMAMAKGRKYGQKYEEVEEAYRPPTAAEIKKDKERENAGKKRPSMSHKSVSNKLYVNMRPKLKEEEIAEAIKAYCLEENISADDLADMNEEQLDEIIGKVVGGAVKMAAKGAYRAAVNKQGNFRLSRAGRADRAEKRAAAMEKKNKDRERIRAAQKRLQAAKQKARQK